MKTCKKSDRRRLREEPLLRAAGVRRVYRRSRRGPPVVALDGVDLELREASIVALVGESGGGKSTLARCLALLERPTAGEILFEGRNTSGLDRRELARVRPRIQLLFQDPAAAVNPRLTAAEAVAEPLRIARRGGRRERRRRALEFLAEVAFPLDLAERRPLELSGGQRQRLVIARALAAEPRLLILDEGLAALDLRLQARLVELLLELRERRGLAYLLISHDLRRAAHLAERVAVLDRGRIVEEAAPAELLRRPRHPHSRALVDALDAPFRGAAR